MTTGTQPSPVTEATLLRWGDLAEGTVLSLPFRVEQADMAAFAQLSGDFNPLHRDEAFAIAAGFSGVVVYGGLILAQVSRLLGMHLPGRHGIWNGLRMDFRAPLYVGEDAVLRGAVEQLSEALRAITLGLSVTAGDRKVATGKAYATMRVHG